MKIETDLAIDVSYIELSEAAYDHTEELADGIVVDVAIDGSLLGVEIIGVSRGWSPEALRERFALDDRTIQAMVQLTLPRVFGASNRAGSASVVTSMTPVGAGAGAGV